MKADISLTFEGPSGPVTAPAVLQWRPFGSKQEWSRDMPPSNLAVEVCYLVEIDDTIDEPPTRPNAVPLGQSREDRMLFDAFTRLADAATRASTTARRSGKSQTMRDIVRVGTALGIDVQSSAHHRPEPEPRPEPGPVRHQCPWCEVERNTLASLAQHIDRRHLDPQRNAADAATRAVEEALKDLGKSQEHIATVGRRLRAMTARMGTHTWGDGDGSLH